MRTPSVTNDYVADSEHVAFGAAVTNFYTTFIPRDEWQSATSQPATWSQLPLDVLNHDRLPESQDGVTHELRERQFSLED